MTRPMYFQEVNTTYHSENSLTNLGSINLNFALNSISKLSKAALIKVKTGTSLITCSPYNSGCQCSFFQITRCQRIQERKYFCISHIPLYNSTLSDIFPSFVCFLRMPQSSEPSQSWWYSPAPETRFLDQGIEHLVSNSIKDGMWGTPTTKVI